MCRAGCGLELAQLPGDLRDCQSGYNSANVFYDSMLPEITTEERMDNVSTMGYALGYIGSVIPFALCLVLVLLHDTFGMS